MKAYQDYWLSDPVGLLRVTPEFRLADSPTDASPGFDSGHDHADDALTAGAALLDGLQERLYAGSRAAGDQRRVLLVLQAMDTAGKGGTIRHVVGSVDPQGVHLAAFKKPTPEELAHDFLWRVEKQLPEAGFIGVFDRSHYEDVLIQRVRQLAPPEEIERRYGAINDFEAKLAESGTSIVKVMLHISPDEQKRRLAERLDRVDKHWKYNPGDVDERELWPKYMDAYEVALNRCTTDAAPWFVVPADKKWYARLVVQHLLIDALTRLHLQWPVATFDVEAEKARLASSL